MTAVGELIRHLDVAGPLHTGEGAEPLGTAWLPRLGLGIDLSAPGYIEEEYLLSGLADEWTWDDTFVAEPLGARRFTTRVLVRRPADASAFSGAVYLEPHHVEDDRAISWGMVAPWILRSGHAHVGVTQDQAIVGALSDWDPERYGRLVIPAATMRWDVVGLTGAAVVTGLLPCFSDLSVDRVVLSGWSQTGTFCRTFLGEGFDCRFEIDGRSIVAGYIVCISSGGAGRPGYTSLRPGAVLPMDDPRRTIGPHGVPVVELLSEGEAETHRSVLRPDGDDWADRYRLYQVAGTGHMTGTQSITTNRAQRQERGEPALGREIEEVRSDARMDLVARAVFELVDQWIAAGSTPPPADRFAFDGEGSGGVHGLMPEALPLCRDGDDNVIGGVRTPWVEVPMATYLPHSTPKVGSCQPGPQAPYTDPAFLADLVPHMVPFSAEELARRYGSPAAYLGRFEQSAQQSAAAGWLLESDFPELLEAKRASRVWW